MKKDLRVLYLDSTGKVRQGFGSLYRASTLTGTSNLVQKIVYYLLTEIGSNYFSSTVGSNFATLNTLNWSPDSQNVIKASITNSVLDIENKIKLGQVTIDLDPVESLKKLEVTTIEYDSSIQGWQVIIEVTNLLDQVFTVSL